MLKLKLIWLAIAFTWQSWSKFDTNPDNNVHEANMGPISGRHEPGGPYVGPKNFPICEWPTLGLVLPLACYK